MIPGTGPKEWRSEYARSIQTLRQARAAFRWLDTNGFLADYERDQMLWKFRRLAAGLGVRLYIAGTSQDTAEIN